MPQSDLQMGSTRVIRFPNPDRLIDSSLAVNERSPMQENLFSHVVESESEAVSPTYVESSEPVQNPVFSDESR